MTSARRESLPNGRRSRIPFWESDCKVLDMAMRWKSQADSPKR